MATANKNLNEPANGSYVNTWDVPVNSNTTILDLALGGAQLINLTGNVTTPIVLVSAYTGAYPANSASYLPQQLELTGTIGVATAIQVPAGVGGMWAVNNLTSGSYAVTFGVVGSAATPINVPAGGVTIVVSDGTNAYRTGSPSDSVFQAGDLKPCASANAQNGWLICYGQAVSRTTYAALFAAIGVSFGNGDGSTTFNVPDYRGNAIVGADNMGGTAAGRLTGYTIGVMGGEQNHTLSIGEMPSHNHGDYGHNHGASDSGHQHTVYAISGNSGTGAPGNFGYALQSISTSVGYANISIATGYANIAPNGGSGAHNNVQPSLACYVFIYTGV